MGYTLSKPLYSKNSISNIWETDNKFLYIVTYCKEVSFNLLLNSLTDPDLQTVSGKDAHIWGPIDWNDDYCACDVLHDLGRYMDAFDDGDLSVCFEGFGGNMSMRYHGARPFIQL